MEVELKFRVPDADLFDRLLLLTTLAGYRLTHPATRAITDTYLDTDDGALRRGGFACRVRHDHTSEKWVGTLKGLGKAEEAVHSRAEYEVPISPDAPPDHWPPSPARDRAMALADHKPVLPLFTIEQTRHTRILMRGQETIGELSLDEIAFHVGTRQIPALELEIELLDAGTPDDLEILYASLIPLGVTPQYQSKFERAQELKYNE